MQCTVPPKPTPFRYLSCEIVFQHRTVADLALTQSLQRLVDLGHREHLHHLLDAVERTEIEHVCNRGRRAHGGARNFLLPPPQPYFP